MLKIYEIRRIVRKAEKRTGNGANQLLLTFLVIGKRDQNEQSFQQGMPLFLLVSVALYRTGFGMPRSRRCVGTLSRPGSGQSTKFYSTEVKA